MTEERFDPYAALGVPFDASDEEITAAYRREALKAHPDREGGSTERMTDVNMAYKILSDPATRAEYDRTGAVGPKDMVLKKAREHLVGMIKTLIRGSAPHVDMIATLRDGLNKQRQGCAESRMKSQSELAMLRDRVRRLKGPPGNFIEGVLLQEIERGEAFLPTYDADEEVFKKAVEILSEYSYDTSFVVWANALAQAQQAGQQGSPLGGVYGILGNPGG